MPIYDITTFTHLDYPDHLSCIVWFCGCNMRCDYCYNKDIVFSKSGNYNFKDVLEFLKTRLGLLDAVVLSGGEATTHDLVGFCQDIKKLGFKIKLDTNGINYTQIKKLVELDLLDYIALDYKAPQRKFTQITHLNQYDKFSKTLTFLIDFDFDFEVRTTLHNDLLNVNDINTIIQDLVKKGYTKDYYIQKFQDTGSNIANIGLATKSFDDLALCNSLNIIWRS